MRAIAEGRQHRTEGNNPGNGYRDAKTVAAPKPTGQDNASKTPKPVAADLPPARHGRALSFILSGCAVLSVMIFFGYALVFSNAPMVDLYRRARGWIEGVLAAVFAFAGLRLLLSRA